MTANHILIADDEPLTRQSLYEILKIEGYKVTTARDGLEALGLIEKLLPEIVISDMKMPGMDGLQLVKEIKSRGLEIPVILITGKSPNMVRSQTRARSTLTENSTLRIAGSLSSLKF